MSADQVLADLRKASGSAGCLFINPPTSTPTSARERAANAITDLHRAARRPRAAIIDRERALAATIVADRAALAVHALAWSSSCPDDRVVILAVSADLALAAAKARADLAPDRADLATRAATLAALADAALAAARRAARC
jgi:hypothetical protein